MARPWNRALPVEPTITNARIQHYLRQNYKNALYTSRAIGSFHLLLVCRGYPRGCVVVRFDLKGEPQMWLRLSSLELVAGVELVKGGFLSSAV